MNNSVATGTESTPDTHDHSHFRVITGNRLTHIWREYNRFVMNGSLGHDAEIPIRERFWVTLHLPRNTDYETHDVPQMDLSIVPDFIFKMFRTEKSPMGDSYGFRIHTVYRLDQLDVMVDKLGQKPESKGAICNLLHPLPCFLEQESGMKMERTACLANLQALIRPEHENGPNHLHLTAHFRSQNAWRSHGNFIAIRRWHEHLLNRLNKKYPETRAELGDLVVRVTAAHVYQPNWESALSL